MATAVIVNSGGAPMNDGESSAEAHRMEPRGGRRRKLRRAVVLTAAALGSAAAIHWWPGSGLLTYLGLDMRPARFSGPSTSAYPLAMPRNDVPGVANFAQVSEQLYRGSQPSPEGFRQLARLGVKTIISLQEFHSDHRRMQGLGLRYVQLRFNPARPTDELTAAFLSVVRGRANQPAFVHCLAGSDRTGTLVAAYRVVEQGWPIEEAARELPRFGFHASWTGLLEYLAALDAERLNALAAVSSPRVEVVP